MVSIASRLQGRGLELDDLLSRRPEGNRELSKGGALAILWNLQAAVGGEVAHA